MQYDIEFDNLARILVQNHPKQYDPTGSLILALANSDGLETKLKDLFLVEILKASLSEDRYDIGISIWNKYEPILIYYADKIVPTVISVFEEHSHSIEYKLFFLKKIYSFMSNNE